MLGALEIRTAVVFTAVLRDLDIESVWLVAEDQQRRVLVEWVSVCPDHLEVPVSGAPLIHVLYQEVG